MVRFRFRVSFRVRDVDGRSLVRTEVDGRAHGCTYI